MRYISLTPEERQLMLQAIGVEKTEDLFESIPVGVRLGRPLDLPEPLSESSLLADFKSMARRNACGDDFAYFLGAGAYHHFIPSVIDTLVSRSEYFTAYTPYQPEVSQGTLQAIFEYQTLIAQLTGMEVANASLYDGASALAEAVMMASRVTRRTRILVPEALHPNYRMVLGTYTGNHLSVTPVPANSAGSMDSETVDALLDDRTAAVVVQSPNFFGVVEEMEELGRLAHRRRALLVAVTTEALSLGLLKPPGEMGADIVAGEGQSLGLPLSFGGPYLGLFATRDRYKRQMPGRLVGQTVDRKDRRGFVLTLSTREQHIRREKATSNICTNQGLCALAVSIFLSTLGKNGIRELAEQNLKKTHYLRRRLAGRLVFSGPVFNEMVLRVDDPESLNQELYREGIIGGLPLGTWFPSRRDQMLVCVTDQNTRRQIDRFIRVLQQSRVTV